MTKLSVLMLPEYTGEYEVARHKFVLKVLTHEEMGAVRKGSEDKQAAVGFSTFQYRLELLARAIKSIDESDVDGSIEERKKDLNGVEVGILAKLSECYSELAEKYEKDIGLVPNS